MITTGISIKIAAPCAGWGVACPQAQKYARLAGRLALIRGMMAARLSLHRPELGIRLTDDATQRRLNRDYRGLDSSTNVLAFPAWQPGEQVPSEAPLLLGDVVLAFETIAGEAAEQAKPLADHLRHLTVHGVLHLLGYEHRTPAEACAMETLETAILEALGVPDPYRDIM